MKGFKTYIVEKFKIDKYLKFQKYNYFPKDTMELDNLVKKLIKERGNDCDLNDIDTSKITIMSYLFASSFFNGDISEWNVSNVTNMKFMFYKSKFNGDINKWDVGNVKDMSDIFTDSPLENNPPSWYKK